MMQLMDDALLSNRPGGTGHPDRSNIMSKTTYTLSNEFHHTEATVRPVEITEGRFKGYHRITKSTARRLRNALCGVSGCTCGGNFGERGGAYLEVINQDWEGNYIVDLDGSHA